jgi:hypothetical protein
MKKPPDWSVDVQSLSHQNIVELLRELKDSPNSLIVSNLRKELVDRLRLRGMDSAQIIKRLANGVVRGRKLNEVAKDWAPALGVTVEEFKRIADAR